MLHRRKERKKENEARENCFLLSVDNGEAQRRKRFCMHKKVELSLFRSPKILLISLYVRRNECT